MMASTSAGSGWTTSRIIALAAGSVLLLISLAFIAGGGTLAWADTEQLRSGYLTTTTTTYSTSGYALASDPIKPHGAWDWLSLLVDRVRIRISSSDRSRPLFAGIAAAGDVERYLGDISYTTVGARGEHDVTDHPGTGVPAAPATALHWAAKTQGTGTLIAHLGRAAWPLDGGGDEPGRLPGPHRPGRGGDVGSGAGVAGRRVASTRPADRRGGGCPDRRVGAAGVTPGARRDLAMTVPPDVARAA